MKKTVMRTLKSPIFKITFIVLAALFFLMLCSSDNSNKVGTVSTVVASTTIDPIIDSVAVVPSQLFVSLKDFEKYYFLQRGDSIKIKSSENDGFIVEIVGCYIGNCPKGESFFISKKRFNTATKLYYDTQFRLDRCCFSW